MPQQKARARRKAPNKNTSTLKNFTGVNQFSHLLERCVYAAIDEQVGRQKAITALPGHDTAFALTQHQKTLMCCSWGSHRKAGYQHKVYGPISGAVARLVPEHTEIVTFNLFIDQHGRYGLIPLEENGSPWSADLRFALQVAEQHAITLMTLYNEDMCSIAAADVTIDTAVPNTVFEEVLCRAFDSLIVDSLEHPFIEPLLTSEQLQRGRKP